MKCALAKTAAAAVGAGHPHRLYTYHKKSTPWSYPDPARLTKVGVELGSRRASDMQSARKAW
jgi:hypothetical protein